MVMGVGTRLRNLVIYSTLAEGYELKIPPQGGYLRALVLERFFNLKTT